MSNQHVKIWAGEDNSKAVPTYYFQNQNNKTLADTAIPYVLTKLSAHDSNTKRTATHRILTQAMHVIIWHYRFVSVSTCWKCQYKMKALPHICSLNSPAKSVLVNRWHKFTPGNKWQLQKVVHFLLVCTLEGRNEREQSLLAGQQRRVVWQPALKCHIWGQHIHIIAKSLKPVFYVYIKIWIDYRQTVQSKGDVVTTHQVVKIRMYSNKAKLDQRDWRGRKFMLMWHGNHTSHLIYWKLE